MTHACITVIGPDGSSIAIHCASSGYVQDGVGDQVHEFMATATAACQTAAELATALVVWMNREGGWVPPEVEFDSPEHGMTGPIGDNEYDYSIVRGAGGWEIDVFPTESLGEAVVHPRERVEIVKAPGRAGQTIALLSVPPQLERDWVQSVIEAAGATVVDTLGPGVDFAVIADRSDSFDYFEKGVTAIGAMEMEEVWKALRDQQTPPLPAHSDHQGRLLVSTWGDQFRFLVRSGGEPADFGEALIQWLHSDEAAMCEGGSSLATQLAVDLNHPDEARPRVVYDPDGSLGAGAEFSYSIVNWQNPKDRFDYGVRVDEYPPVDEEGSPVVHPQERDPAQLPEPSQASGAYFKAGGQMTPRMVGFTIGGDEATSADGLLLDEPEPLAAAAAESEPPAKQRVKVELRQGDRLDAEQARQAISQVAGLAGLELPLLGGPWVVVLDDAWDSEAELEWPRVIGGFASDEEAQAWIRANRPPGSCYTVTVTPPDDVELT